MLSVGIHRDVNDQLWTLPVVTKVKSRIPNNLDLNRNYFLIADSPLSFKGERI